MWKANGGTDDDDDDDGRTTTTTTTDGRRTPTHDKNSHGLWSGELEIHNNQRQQPHKIKEKQHELHHKYRTNTGAQKGKRFMFYIIMLHLRFYSIW
jgi:hypothetical protein